MTALMTADLAHLGDVNVREPFLIDLLDSGEIYENSTGIALSEWLDAHQQEMEIVDLAGGLAVLSVIGWAAGNLSAAFKFASQAYALDSNLGHLVVSSVRSGLPFSEFADTLLKHRDQILADRK
jgi:hypothetical protein